MGWKAAVALGRRHRVHVLTSASEKQAIGHALDAEPRPNLSFTYFGDNSPYHENRLIARLQSWCRYLVWVKQSLSHARQLVSNDHFDIAHHVTYSSWRVASPLWRLDIPFVWGPVGGVAEYPRHLRAKLSFRSAAFEVARGLSSQFGYRSNNLRKCVRNASAVIASNRETLEKLTQLRGNHCGLHMLFPTFFTQEQMESLDQDPESKPRPDPLRVFAGGNIIGSKGITFALEALRIATNQGVNAVFTIGGYGPEIPFLRRKARLLGLVDKVNFHPGFIGAEYRNELKSSHLVLMPSFRENAGITMLEAMLAGCVPVIVDASAQGDVVNESCGFKIPVGKAEEISQGLAEALVLLARKPELRISMGRNAAGLVKQRYHEAAYIEGLERIYAEALDR